MTLDEAPTFPPLLQGMAAPAAQDPFEAARAQAALGCDAGLIVHAIREGTLHAAIVFAPEMPLRQATTAFVICGIGFQNALGALAPPEVGVHLQWDGGLRVNGAACGRLRLSASTRDPDAEPDWIVVGLDVPLRPKAGTNPGDDPNHTWLSEEGCVDVPPTTLLEAWARHTLLWVNRWLDEGARPVHTEWRALAHGIGAPIDIALEGTRHHGTFMGVDEDFGLLLRDGDTTRVLPLSLLVDQENDT
ncbi:MAG: DUF4444 domain-containing protein [Pseudomonadota bacterium]